MKYNRTALLELAKSSRAEWVAHFAADESRKAEQYEVDLQKWLEVYKPKVVADLERKLERIKADKQVSHYLDLQAMAPAKPKGVDGDYSCYPTVKTLSCLIELLETLTDEEITPSALSMSGLKNVVHIVKRPC